MSIAALSLEIIDEVVEDELFDVYEELDVLDNEITDENELRLDDEVEVELEEFDEILQGLDVEVLDDYENAVVLVEVVNDMLDDEVEVDLTVDDVDAVDDETEQDILNEVMLLHIEADDDELLVGVVVDVDANE